MFDFRYHALSLVAVFLALAIGIVLGVTLGDSVVSQADRNLRSNLRGNVESAREGERVAREQLEGADAVIEEALPMVAAQRLSGSEVAIVASGTVPSEVEQSAREAVEVAGGEVTTVTVLTSPPARELVEAAGQRPEELERSDDALDALGRSIGASLVRGGPLVGRLAEELPDRFRGRYGDPDGIVFYRTPADTEARSGESDEERRRRERRERFETALIDGMRGAAVPVVGVEESDTEPSQVPFYGSRGLTSVDSVDLAGGRLALVFTLAGREGTFGYKRTAEAPVPDL